MVWTNSWNNDTINIEEGLVQDLGWGQDRNQGWEWGERVRH